MYTGKLLTTAGGRCGSWTPVGLAIKELVTVAGIQRFREITLQGEFRMAFSSNRRNKR